MPVRTYLPGSYCQVSNPTDTRFQSYARRYFGPHKGDGAQNPLFHAHHPNFIWGFCSCGGSNRILKIWAKFTKPNWCMAILFGRNLRKKNSAPGVGRFGQTHFRNKPTFFPYCISLNYVQACSIIAMYTGFKTRDTTTTTMTACTNERFAALRTQINNTV